MPANGRHSDDSHLANALRAFQDAVDAGAPLDRSAFLAEHPSVADDLRDCLDGLLLMRDLTSPTGGVPPAGQPLGDFKLLREIGRGGMGVVYEAEQLSLGRRVALKVLPFAATLDSRRLQRFRTEAAAAGHLRHPHVVAVHGVGCERGVHYYAMQFVDGPSLAEVLRRVLPADPDATASEAGPATRAHRTTVPTGTGGDFRTVAGWIADAADALDHAHQYGVIHRDVKPGNLLLDADGTLYVADFGLAQMAGGGGVTRTGDVLGTLRYMPPEQLCGERALDPRSDVYSLGATLYELLTFQPAFDAGGRPELVRQILDEDPPPARRVRPAVPAELAIIAHKAMAKSPGDRYATAKALADDLRAWLDDRPIRARPPTPLQRLTRLVRRYRAAAVAIGVGLVLAVAALVVSTVLVAAKNVEARAALRERDQALAASMRQQAELADSLQRETRAAYGFTLALADRARRDGDRERAAALLAECPPALRGWEWHHLGRRLNDSLFAAREKGYLNRPRFASDGRTITAVLAGERDGPPALLCWDVPDGQRLPEFRAAEAGSTLAVSPDGRRIAAFDLSLLAASPGHGVRIFDADGGRELSRIDGPPAGVLAVAFAPDGGRLAVAASDGSLGVYRADCGGLAWSARASGPALDAAFAPDGREVALLAAMPDSELSELQLFDAATGTKRAAFGGLPCGPFHETTRQLTYSPDGRYIVVPTGRASPPLLLRAVDGRRVALPAAATVRAFTPDSKSAIVLLTDGAAALVDPATGATVLRMPLRQPAEVGMGSWELNRTSVPVAVTVDGRCVAIALDDGLVTVLSLTTGREIVRLTGNGKPNGLAFSPDGSKLALTAIYRGLTVWELATATEARVLSPGGDGQSVSGLAVRHNGGAVAALLASKSGAHEVVVWNPATGQESLRRPAGVLGIGWASSRGTLTFAADGRLAAGGYVRQPLPPDQLVAARAAVVWAPDGTILQVQTDQLAGDDAAHAVQGDGCIVRFDPAGRLRTLLLPRAAPNGVDTVTVRCLDSFGPAQTWERSIPPVKSFAATPDGRRLALAFAAPFPALQVWDVSSTQVLWELPPVPAGVRLAATLSADGRRLLTRPAVGTAPTGAPEWARRAVVWDALTGIAVCALDPPSVPGAWNGRVVSAFAFSPDGRRLVSFGGVPGVKVWDAASGRELLTLGDDGPPVTEAAFGEDGFLITADDNGAVRAWDGRPLRE